MFMAPSTWELASLICKLFVYFGAASLVGGSLFLWLYNDGSRKISVTILRYIVIGSFLGFQGSLFNFLIQVGMVVDNGLIGMLDLGMASIFLDTQLGDTTFFRLGGFVLSFTTGLFYLQRIGTLDRTPPRAFYRLLNTGNIIAFLLVVFSFRFTGHISVLSLIAKLAIAIHFFAFAAWIGSLYPLYRLTYSGNIGFMQNSMKRFGDHAITVVLMLIVAGVLMLFELFHSINEVFTTPYGQAFLVKLILVLFILGIAGVNKLKLTPGLVNERGVVSLRHSIRIEIVLAILILCITSYFSTIVGPPGHQMG
jgi:putative copper resistance protein D